MRNATFIWDTRGNATAAYFQVPMINFNQLRKSSLKNDKKHGKKYPIVSHIS